jgi:hypothetical protein
MPDEHLEDLFDECALEQAGFPSCQRGLQQLPSGAGQRVTLHARLCGERTLLTGANSVYMR